MRKIFILLSFILMFIVSGCQTYTQQNAKIREEMYAGRFKDAADLLDKSPIASEGRNFSLFKMEKGMLLYLQNDYSNAVTNWNLADRKLDDLYTTSISKTTASFAINDSMSDYTGEAHERILLPIFSSIAFFANNDQNNALVMIRRAYDIKKYLDTEKEGENLFKYDAFSYYFSGMVYESKNDLDNAIVSYRNALKNINKNSDTFKDAEEQIYKDLGRLSEFKRRNDILTEIKKSRPNLSWEKHEKYLNSGEVYIIYESGKAPIKYPKDFTVPSGSTVVRISFPEYKKISYSNTSAQVYLNDKLYSSTIVMENIGKMAEQALNDRRVRDIVKLAARVLSKDLAARKIQKENPYAGLAATVFNVATEQADTRSWTSLPDTIQVLRIPVPANKESKITIKPIHGESKDYTVKLQANEKQLIRMRTSN